MGVFEILTIIGLVLGGVQAYRANKQAKDLKKRASELLITKFGTGEYIPVLYGRRRIAGTVLFAETVKQKDLFVVYALSVGELEEIHGDTILIDGDRLDKQSRFKGDNFIIRNDRSENYGSGTALFGSTTEDKNRVLDVTGTTNIKVVNKEKKKNAKNYSMVFNLHHGSTTQTADPLLTSIFDGQDNRSTWTANHRLRGIAYIVAHFQHKTDGRFRGLPDLTVEIEGRKVYDPRLDSTETGGSGSHRKTDTSTHSGTPNPAINFLDYITNAEYGKGIPFADIDIPSFQTAADICDNTVATLNDSGFTVSSGQTGNKQDKLIIPISSIDNFSNLKIGNSITVTDDSDSSTVASGLITGKHYFAGTDGIIDHYELNMAPGSVASTFNSSKTVSASQAQKRFEYNGAVDTSETLMTNANEFLASMRGMLIYEDSKYKLKIEHSVSQAALNISEDDILEEGIQLSLESKETKFNKVEVSFFNAQKNYEKDSVVYTGETGDNFLAEDNNEVLEEKVNLPMVTNHQVAYNHAKSILFRSRRQRRLKFTGSPKLLSVSVGDVVGVTHSKFDLSSNTDQFRITKMTLESNLNVQIEAIEYQADIYGYAAPPAEQIDYPNQSVDRTAVTKPSNLTFVDKDPTTGIQAFLSWEDANVYPSRFRVTVRNEQFVKRTVATSDGSATTVDTTYKIIGDSISNQTMSFLEAGYIASTNYSFADGTFTYNQAGISGKDLSALKYPFDELFATSGNGSTAAFTFNTALSGLTTANIVPFIDGVYQAPESFAFDSANKTLTFDAAPPNTSLIEVFMDDGIEVLSVTSTGQAAFNIDPIFDVDTMLVFIGGGYQKADAFSITEAIDGITVTFDESISSGTKVHFVLMPEKVEGVIYTTITDETSIDLSNIRINDGYKGEVSAINAFGFESEPATIIFTNDKNPVQLKYDVPDNSITAAKVVDTTITQAKLESAVSNALNTIPTHTSDIGTLQVDVAALQSTVNDSNTGVTANAQAVTQLNTSITSTNTNVAANASSITTLNTSVNNISSSVTSLQTATSDLQGNASSSFVLQTDANGAVSQMILESNASAGTNPTSIIKFRADTFQITNNSTGAIAPFDVTGGVVTINNAAIVNLSADKLTANTLNVAGKAVSGTAGNITGNAGVEVTNLSNDNANSRNSPSTWFASNPPHFYNGSYMPLIASHTWTTPAFSGTKEYIITAQGIPLGSFGGDEETTAVLLVRQTNSATGYLSSNAANFVVSTGIFTPGRAANNPFVFSDKFSASGNTQYYAYLLMTVADYGTGNKGVTDAAILVYGLGV